MSKKEIMEKIEELEKEKDQQQAFVDAIVENYQGYIPKYAPIYDKVNAHYDKINEINREIEFLNSIINEVPINKGKKKLKTDYTWDEAFDVIQEYDEKGKFNDLAEKYGMDDWIYSDYSEHEIRLQLAYRMTGNEDIICDAYPEGTKWLFRVENQDPDNSLFIANTPNPKKAIQMMVDDYYPGSKWKMNRFGEISIKQNGKWFMIAEREEM